MEYLKKFNLTDDDLLEISESLDDMDYREIVNKENKIESILKYFISIGITNVKDIILYKSYILHDSLFVIKDKLENVSDMNIIRLINEDVNNFSLIGY